MSILTQWQSGLRKVNYEKVWIERVYIKLILERLKFAYECDGTAKFPYEWDE